MGLLDIVPVSHSTIWIAAFGLICYIQAGVLTGDNVRKLFDYAKENKVCCVHARKYISWFY